MHLPEVMRDFLVFPNSKDPLLVSYSLQRLTSCISRRRYMRAAKQLSLFPGYYVAARAASRSKHQNSAVVQTQGVSDRFSPVLITYTVFDDPFHEKAGSRTQSLPVYGRQWRTWTLHRVNVLPILYSLVTPPLGALNFASRQPATSHLSR